MHGWTLYTAKSNANFEILYPFLSVAGAGGGGGGGWGVARRGEGSISPVLKNWHQNDSVKSIFINYRLQKCSLCRCVCLGWVGGGGACIRVCVCACARARVCVCVLFSPENVWVGAAKGLKVVRWGRWDVFCMPKFSACERFFSSPEYVSYWVFGGTCVSPATSRFLYCALCSLRAEFSSNLKWILYFRCKVGAFAIFMEAILKLCCNYFLWEQNEIEKKWIYYYFSI